MLFIAPHKYSRPPFGKRYNTHNAIVVYKPILPICDLSGKINFQTYHSELQVFKYEWSIRSKHCFDCIIMLIKCNISHPRISSLPYIWDITKGHKLHHMTLMANLAENKFSNKVIVKVDKIVCNSCHMHKTSSVTKPRLSTWTSVQYLGSTDQWTQVPHRVLSYKHDQFMSPALLTHFAFSLFT